MTSTCCIGHYSTLSKDYTVIQGEYYNVLNDPLYIRDESEQIYPISDPSIFKPNKKYDAPPDLLAGNGMEVKSGLYSSRPHQSGHGRRKLWKKIIDEEQIKTHAVRDIRKGRKEIIDLIKKHGKKVSRPIKEDLSKMSKFKAELPGEKLKKRLAMKSHKDLATARTYLKDLAKRVK